MVSQTAQWKDPFGACDFLFFIFLSHSYIVLIIYLELLVPLPSPRCASILWPQARIKAINTFFAKNGYRSMDSSSLYAQQSQSQSQFSSPLYMQHVYPQQQYPVYGIVPPTWTPSPTPYFETPLVRDGCSAVRSLSFS